MFFGFTGFLLLGFVWFSVAPYSATAFFEIFSTASGRFIEIQATLFVAACLSGLCIGLTSGTPGKFLFGVRVVDQNLHPIGVYAALAREWYVYLYGFGLGIPIVTLITQGLAFRDLRRDGFTSWDAEKYVVLYRRRSGVHNLLTAIGIILMVFLFIFLRGLLAEL